MPQRGYRAVEYLRDRPGRKRGGRPEYTEKPGREQWTLASYFEDHLRDMQVHNCTEKAVESKRGELLPFLRWAEERDLVYPDQISLNILESYQRHLWRYRKKNGKPLGISTQRGRLGSLKVFFSWLCKHHVLEANPASDIEPPKPEKRLPIESLSIEEMETVLSVPDIADPLGIRDRAILELFYSTGIRRMELTRLRISDLNRDKKLLAIRQGKGRKDRVVPVGERALAWVNKYLDEVRPLLLMRADEQALFLSGYGTSLSAGVLGYKIGQYIRKADVGRTGGPHLIRHTCATHLLEGGADIRYIQQLLGHESLETTAIYTEVSIIQLQAVHSRCHPAETRRRS